MSNNETDVRTQINIRLTPEEAADLYRITVIRCRPDRPNVSRAVRILIAEELERLGSAGEKGANRGR